MSKQSLAALLVLSVLTGCSDHDKPNLALACSLTKCTCLSDGGGGYFERNFSTNRTISTAVLWTERGDAYCPEGYSLRQVDENKKKQYYTPRGQTGQ